MKLLIMVLILILLEVTQINFRMSVLFALGCLNPYSTGSNSNCITLAPGADLKDES